MLIGFALTQHCNLRCPHCIRDDVATVRSLEPELVLRVADDARHLFGPVTVSFTGGEPTLHQGWDRIVAGLAERGIPYRFVTNGWHMKRLMPAIDRWPPQSVRLSLSGASEAVHDAERGRGSYRRVLLALALLTSRRIPTVLSMVIDRRDRHALETAATLAEQLGCTGLNFILPQPVPASAARDSDLEPEAWAAVRAEVERLASDPARRTRIQLDYGAPAPHGMPELECDTKAGHRVYVDAHGRLSLCCQLSDYGGNAADVVADLHEVSLVEAWGEYERAMDALRARSAPRDGDGNGACGTGLDAFPCMRCARELGKLRWLADSAAGAWQALAAG